MLIYREFGTYREAKIKIMYCAAIPAFPLPSHPLQGRELEVVGSFKWSQHCGLIGSLSLSGPSSILQQGVCPQSERGSHLSKVRSVVQPEPESVFVTMSALHAEV